MTSVATSEIVVLGSDHDNPGNVLGVGGLVDIGAWQFFGTGLVTAKFLIELSEAVAPGSFEEANMVKGDGDRGHQELSLVMLSEA